MSFFDAFPSIFLLFLALVALVVLWGLVVFGLPFLVAWFVATRARRHLIRRRLAMLGWPPTMVTPTLLNYSHAVWLRLPPFESVSIIPWGPHHTRPRQILIAALSLIKELLDSQQRRNARLDATPLGGIWVTSGGRTPGSVPAGWVLAHHRKRQLQQLGWPALTLSQDLLRAPDRLWRCLPPHDELSVIPAPPNRKVQSPRVLLRETLILLRKCRTAARRRHHGPDQPGTGVQ